MSVGQKENILFPPIHVKWLGFVFHYFKVECGEKVRAAEGCAWVTTLASMYHSQTIPSYLRGYIRKCWHKILWFS
jgi:hypothetical protein